MKKLFCVFLTAAMMLALCACGAKTPEVSGPAEEKNMLDLTAMSSTVMFAELFNMTMEPENYVGRTIKMKGKFSALPNPISGDTEYALLTMDAAACCVQGLDLSLAEGRNGMPAVDSEVTVTGIFQKYTDQGMTRYRIGDAAWE